MRKSTSIRVATSLLRDHITQSDSKLLLIESKARYSEILYELARSSRKYNQAQLTIVASELAASFGRGGGVGNVVALLTDLYDCPDVRVGAASVKDGIPSYNLRDVFVGFLAGSTPAWLEKTVTPTVIEGGFTSRCYFVVGKSRKRSIPWPSGDKQEELRALLLKQLKEIADASNSTPRIGITERGKRTFTEWYDSRILHRDSYRESFESREDAHILRFGGIYAANEKCWQIDDDHIRRAIRTVADIKDFGHALFTGVSIQGADLNWIKKLREVIIKAGDAGISRMDLSRTVNPRGDRSSELRSTLHTMHELDLIKVEEVTIQGRTGRPKTIYKPTMFLANEEFMADVMRKLGMDR